MVGCWDKVRCKKPAAIEIDEKFVEESESFTEEAPEPEPIVDQETLVEMPQMEEEPPIPVLPYLIEDEEKQ